MAGDHWGMIGVHSVLDIYFFRWFSSAKQKDDCAYIFITPMQEEVRAVTQASTKTKDTRCWFIIRCRDHGGRCHRATRVVVASLQLSIFNRNTQKTHR